jgi:hypothetical protein
MAKNDVTVGQETNRALLIKINNAPELARSQGALASFVQALAPSTIEAKVYDTMKGKLEAALKAQNVDATLTIVEPKAFTSAGNGHVARDVGLAVAGAGVLAVMWHLFKGRKRK